MEKVTIKITGNHSDTQKETVGVEQIFEGEYGFRDGSHYVFYEEKSDQYPRPVKCRIKYKGDLLELVKGGPGGTGMCFEVGKRNEVLYRSPFGDLMLENETESIVMEEEEKQILFQIKYRLIAEDEPVSDCTLTSLISRV